MPSSPQHSPTRESVLPLLLQRSVLLLLLFTIGFQFYPSTALSKQEFQQVHLTGCSTWPQNQQKKGCVIKDPKQLTTATLTATQDHEVLYFDLIAKRRFSRAYLDGVHQRVEFHGKVSVDGGHNQEFESGEETNIQGMGKTWEVSFPRRIVWAKDVKKGQKVSIQLDFIKVFMDRKTSETAEDYAQMGVIEFAIVAESDSNWLVRRITAIKAVAFSLVVPLVIHLIRKTELSWPTNSLACIVLGVSFLVLTWPVLSSSNSAVAEEYFSSKSTLLWNYITFTLFETMMGFQAILETFRPGSKARAFLIPVMLLTYLILWYTRHAHLADSTDFAIVYSDGDSRVFKQYYMRLLNTKSLLLSTLPCTLLSLAAPLFKREFSPVSIFLVYSIFSFAFERHTLAQFSTWKFARDLAVWILGYFYLIKSVTAASITGKAHAGVGSQTGEEEIAPIIVRQ